MAAKLDDSGNLLWNTFLGGSGNDTTIGGGIAIDAKGDVLLFQEAAAFLGEAHHGHLLGAGMPLRLN